MGIHDLSKVIGDNASHAVKETEMKNLFGRKVAIDASMSIYQFLIAVRSEGSNLTNAEGETTSHLSGIFYRTIRMVNNGVKPVYVFDGKPPTLKSGELAKRTERRKEAQSKLEAATEEGVQADMEKFTRRLVKVTPEHNRQCQELLDLMGIPYIVAPCEAEAQCAELVKAGKVFATATEDMDALTFGTSVLLRHMTFSEARKMPIQQFELKKVLEGLDLSQDEFIDLCILLGCDYCDKIGGIGRVRAYSLIKEHHSIEAILEAIKKEKKKYTVPDDWKFAEARELFKNPEVAPAKDIDLKWNIPDVDKLVDFMCNKHGFEEGRIRRGAEKLVKARSTSTQGRLDSFFKVLPGGAPKKRKSSENKAGAKKGKGGKVKGKGRK
ncbi:flap endonuclease-1 [Salpingoeca rosetta]|uniref:Flap endonuclease 1 n=1 Tax=Salpingoeca rosetta (strain ATCC 50818 / BSB-021) TaxID=946362 RepID=F2UFW3_SALR5|nr:flap endonuclease-1 [Salpingoeca rosetta]EGD75391.1 flap endonuclease-1 [Salpingoeca rosetta]|eukprot:XP_004991848.1 flap endonuclease-1 [Salpingoeca rosetta]